MKVGIIRCQQTEDTCPGANDFRIAREGKGVFEGLGEIEIVGFVSCGGCPGKKAVTRAKMLVERGAEVVVFSSCIAKSSFPCPNFAVMKSETEKKLGDGVRVFAGSH